MNVEAKGRRNAAARSQDRHSFGILGQVRDRYLLEYETVRLSIAGKRLRLCRALWCELDLSCRLFLWNN